jgi:N-acetylmuramoyl-L-alanine amidase
MHTAPLTSPLLVGIVRFGQLGRSLAWLACMLCLAWALDGRAAVAVKAARLGSSVDSQRIVIELAAPVVYKYFTLSSPSRLVLDLEGVDPESPMLKELAATIKTDDTYLAGLRLAANRPGVTRLVADLKMQMRPLVTLLRASGAMGPRLVIDLVPGAPVVMTPAKSAPTQADLALPDRVRANASEALQAPPPSQVSTVAETPPAAEKIIGKPAEPDHVQAAGADLATPSLPVAAPDQVKTVGAPPVAVSPPPAKTVAPPAVLPIKAAAKSAKVAKVVPRVIAPPAAVVKPESIIRVAAADSLDRQVEQAIQKSDKAGVEAKLANPESSFKRLVTVAIDAGHGGIDPGALGANGSHEKDITLAVARRLKMHIDNQEGMRAVLTRDGDYFIPLHERVNKARRNQADLFVSIHADAFLKSTAKGSSVFALSEKGASSAAARWLAKRENDADLVGGINIDVKNVYLKQTLIDLSQTATIADSLRLGKAVLDEIGEINSLHKPRVEQAGFAVLKAPDIPSILVETAFISNPDEEAKLNDEDYQDKMAAAIVSGIKAYFDNNPPLARSKVAQNF